MNVSSNMYDMPHIHELFLTLITLWFEHTDCFQNEVMPLFHGTLQLYTNQTSSRWKKVNKMRYFTVIADLNFALQ